MSSQPFGVDLSNAQFNTSERESSATETAPSGDSAPTGEALKDEAPVQGNERGASPEVAPKAPQRELTQAEYEKWLGLESEPQAVADTKKFTDNFQYDIATLIKDPSQFAKFSQIYPPEFVERARQIMMANGVNPYAPVPKTEPPKANDPWADPRLQEALNEIQGFKAQQREQRIEAMGSKLDSAFGNLKQKYQFAEPELVNARMMALNAKNISFVDKSGNLQMKAIEQLFKQDHEARKASFQKHYKTMVDSQKNANLRAKDMGSGGSLGSVPGTKPKTIKETTKAILSDLHASR